MLTVLPPPPWSDGIYLDEGETPATTSSSSSSDPTTTQQQQQKIPFTLPDLPGGFSLSDQDSTNKYLQRLSGFLSQYYSQFPHLVPGLTQEDRDNKVEFDGLFLEKMVSGYRLIQKERGHGGGANKHVDRYLVGHPGGGKYRSVNEFFPHVLWLATDSTRSRKNCKCGLCPSTIPTTSSSKNSRQSLGGVGIVKRESSNASASSAPNRRSKSLGGALQQLPDTPIQPGRSRVPVGFGNKSSALALSASVNVGVVPDIIAKEIAELRTSLASNHSASSSVAGGDAVVGGGKGRAAVGSESIGKGVGRPTRNSLESLLVGVESASTKGLGDGVKDKEKVKDKGKEKGKEKVKEKEKEHVSPRKRRASAIGVDAATARAGEDEEKEKEKELVSPRKRRASAIGTDAASTRTGEDKRKENEEIEKEKEKEQFSPRKRRVAADAAIAGAEEEKNKEHDAPMPRLTRNRTSNVQEVEKTTVESNAESAKFNCAATTKAGDSCQNNVSEAGGFCNRHKSTADSGKRPAEEDYMNSQPPLKKVNAVEIVKESEAEAIVVGSGAPALPLRDKESSPKANEGLMPFTSSPDRPSGISDDGKIYCYCGQGANDRGMVGCDNPNGCKIDWFHLECVGLTKPPTGTWYCPDCASILQPTKKTGPRTKQTARRSQKIQQTFDSEDETTPSTESDLQKETATKAISSTSSSNTVEKSSAAVEPAKKPVEKVSEVTMASSTTTTSTSESKGMAPSQQDATPTSIRPVKRVKQTMRRSRKIAQSFDSEDATTPLAESDLQKEPATKAVSASSGKQPSASSVGANKAEKSSSALEPAEKLFEKVSEVTMASSTTTTSTSKSPNKQSQQQAASLAKPSSASGSPIRGSQQQLKEKPTSVTPKALADADVVRRLVSVKDQSAGVAAVAQALEAVKASPRGAEVGSLSNAELAKEIFAQLTKMSSGDIGVTDIDEVEVAGNETAVDVEMSDADGTGAVAVGEKVVEVVKGGAQTGSTDVPAVKAVEFPGKKAAMTASDVPKTVLAPSSTLIANQPIQTLAPAVNPSVDPKVSIPASTAWNQSKTLRSMPPAPTPQAKTPSAPVVPPAATLTTTSTVSASAPAPTATIVSPVPTSATVTAVGPPTTAPVIASVAVPASATLAPVTVAPPAAVVASAPSTLNPSAPVVAMSTATVSTSVSAPPATLASSVPVVANPSPIYTVSTSIPGPTASVVPLASTSAPVINAPTAPV
ncbi:hypothetical protein HDU76_006794, partial [Blyttiomyces sp. JEL0837]